METINVLGEFILIDIFKGYALFSVLFVFASFFVKDKILLEKANDASNKVLIAGGLIYLIIMIVGIVHSFVTAETEYDKYCLGNRLFGPYWFGFWVQPILWVLITQLLWFKKVAESKVLRIVFSVLFAITIEMLLIFIVSFQRHYWLFRDTRLDLSPLEILLYAFLKVCFFAVYCYIYYFISEKIKANRVAV